MFVYKTTAAYEASGNVVRTVMPIIQLTFKTENTSTHFIFLIWILLLLPVRWCKVYEALRVYLLSLNLSKHI